jgi:hypothetical protein
MTGDFMADFFILFDNFIRTNLFIFFADYAFFILTAANVIRIAKKYH